MLPAGTTNVSGVLSTSTIRPSRQGNVDFYAWQLAAVLIEQAQRPKPTAIRQHVVREARGPALLAAVGTANGVWHSLFQAPE